MSNELIERLAREAGGDREEIRHSDEWLEQLTTFDDAALARFAALVAERCAQIADDTDAGYGDGSCAEAGRAIRAAFPMPKDEAPPTAEQWTADEIAAARSSGAAPLTFNKISGPMPKD